jgi:hypothetical protein
MKTDTPQTDAEQIILNPGYANSPCVAVAAEFARRLERELIIANKKIKIMQKALDDIKEYAYLMDNPTEYNLIFDTYKTCQINLNKIGEENA